MMWTIACGVVVGLGLFKAFEGLVEMVVEYPEVLLWLFKLPFKLPALLDADGGCIGGAKVRL